MKNVALAAVVAMLFSSSAFAVELNIWVESNGTSSLGDVVPGSVIPFSVKGLLTNATDNKGLALIGFTLELVEAGDPSTQAGVLLQADMVRPGDMQNFADDTSDRLGLNNPAGYTGTEVIAGRLDQIGGAQNTIRNTVDCTVDNDCPGASNTCEDVGGGNFECSASAPFPLGTVQTGVGHTVVEFVSGTFTAPAVEGDYLLKLTGVFANVISFPQPPGIEFDAAEQATIAPGNVTDLSFSSPPPCAVVAVVFDDPATGIVDARQPRDIQTGAILMGIDTIEVSGVGIGTDTACWSVCESQVEGAALSVANVTDNLDNTFTIDLGRRITPGAVSRITYLASGHNAVYTSMPGDSNADLLTNASDIPDMISCCMNGACTAQQDPVYSCDINHSLAVNSEDIVRLVDLHNGAGAFTEWRGQPSPTGCP